MNGLPTSRGASLNLASKDGLPAGSPEAGVTRASSKATGEVIGTFRLPYLPNELVNHVFSFLESQCPSEVNFNQQPGPDLTRSKIQDLKNVSLVSKQLRKIVLPRLFKHAKFDPYWLTSFLSFIKTNRLAPHVRSLVASLQGPCNHVHPAWWARLLNDTPATTLTIICAPHIFAELVATSIAGVDSWAFNMPYQVIKFEQRPEDVSLHISLNNLPNLFSARPWISFSVNEGSSLKAYTTYEYFLRRTPSLMAVLHHRRSTLADPMFEQLQSFSFTAIFPFYNHIDEILKCVRKMKKLKVLTTKLCPEPDSTVLRDEIEEAQGHIDVNDPWNEFDTSYNLIAHTVIFLTVEGSLEELRVDDVKMEGIKDTIEGSVSRRLREWWVYDGDGVWQRRLTRATVSDTVERW